MIVRCPSLPATFRAVILDRMSDVTQILSAIEQGDPLAAEQLLPLVYGELRKLAAARMAQEKPGHTLNATALVHEAYLRLVGDQHFDGRGHFFAAAAQAMRRILVDHARARKAAKRGGGRRVELESDHLVSQPPDDALEALDDALSRLAIEQPQLAELVQLHFFAGLTLGQCAEVLGVSARTADTWWAYARAWLGVALKKT
jgi:RNA polymerase sigma factor (TIGR02999 family)